MGRWWEQAECRRLVIEAGADPRWWDPLTDLGRPDKSREAEIRYALTACSNCDVIAECGIDAHEYGDTGVRGGVYRSQHRRRVPHQRAHDTARNQTGRYG